MNNKICKAACAVLVSAMLAACGGGGDSSADAATPGATTPPPRTDGNPTPGAAPTLVLTDNSATTTALADEAKVAIAAGLKRSQAPAGVSLFAVPAGVVTTINCTAGGTITYDFPDTISAGTTYSFNYNNCSYATGFVTNGTYVIKYDSFNSATNFAWTITYNLNFTGNTTYSYSGSQSCSYVGGVASCTFSESGRTFESSFVYANGMLNGSYQWTQGTNGTVRFVFTDWGATSGTIQVTGANSTSATIVRTSATTITITINGGTPRIVTG